MMGKLNEFVYFWQMLVP